MSNSHVRVGRPVIGVDLEADGDWEDSQREPSLAQHPSIFHLWSKCFIQVPFTYLSYPAQTAAFNTTKPIVDYNHLRNTSGTNPLIKVKPKLIQFFKKQLSQSTALLYEYKSEFYISDQIKKSFILDQPKSGRQKSKSKFFYNVWIFVDRKKQQLNLVSLKSFDFFWSVWYLDIYGIFFSGQSVLKLSKSWWSPCRSNTISWCI